jgi:hypothetical protein
LEELGENQSMMKFIVVHLSRTEVSILLGAQLMYLGVPFWRTEKPSLTEDEYQRINKNFETTCNHFDKTSTNIITICFNNDMLLNCISILNACLAECGDNGIDLELHLHSRSRAPIDLLIAKLIAMVPEG